MPVQKTESRLPTGFTASDLGQSNYESLKTSFNALSQDNKTDLFNLLCFPKSNYKMVKLIIEKLKDK